jgi:hypothetical protein
VHGEREALGIVHAVKPILSARRRASSASTLTVLLNSAYHKLVGVQTQTEGKSTEDGAGATPKRKTGFALLDDDARRRIAKSGGQASARSDKAWRWTAEMAREMAPLGGHAARDKRRATEQG